MINKIFIMFSIYIYILMPGKYAYNLGATRGKGSSTRMYNYCVKRTSNPTECIQQFITITPQQQEESYLYSKNNRTNGGFPVGETVLKDMSNNLYTYRFNPNEYQNDFFTGMAPFTDGNIVAGDKDPADRLIASYWDDWGNDIFDRWGFFYLYDVEQGKYYFPLITPQNQANGEIYTQTFIAFDRVFTIKQGYPVQGIFKFDISVNDDKPFKFGGYGLMGSLFFNNNSPDTYEYSIGSTNLKLYYVKQYHRDISDQILYAYYIPKKVSENNTQTYNLDVSTDGKNNLMSNVVTNGLIVYFSKINDVKEWVVNDLGLQN